MSVSVSICLSVCLSVSLSLSLSGGRVGKGKGGGVLVSLHACSATARPFWLEMKQSLFEERYLYTQSCSIL